MIVKKEDKRIIAYSYDDLAAIIKNFHHKQKFGTFLIDSVLQAMLTIRDDLIIIQPRFTDEEFYNLMQKEYFDGNFIIREDWFGQKNVIIMTTKHELQEAIKKAIKLYLTPNINQIKIRVLKEANFLTKKRALTKNNERR